MPNFPKEWESFLDIQTNFPIFQALLNSVLDEYSKQEVYPKVENIFRSFELCKPSSIKVVILGQDPYHTPNVADGLAFSTFASNPIPPSLRNIFKEISEEYNLFQTSFSPDLSRWSKQGVLLLNSSLTVRSGAPLSHNDLGWEKFTDIVISKISTKRKNIVFMLWGKFARSKSRFILSSDHLILESVHPSPFSARLGFFGNNHFRFCNEYLLENQLPQIDWVTDQI